MSDDNDTLGGRLIGLAIHFGIVIMAGYNVGPTCGLVTVIVCGILIAALLGWLGYQEYDLRRRVKNMNEALAKLDREFAALESEDEFTDSEPV